MGEENLEKIRNGKYATLREKEYADDDPSFKTRLERETEQRERFDVTKAKERQNRVDAMKERKDVRREQKSKRRQERLQIEKEKLEIHKTKTAIARSKAERRRHSSAHTLISTLASAKKRRQPQRKVTGTRQRVQKQDIVYIDGVPYIRAGKQSQKHSQPKKKESEKKPLDF